MSLKVGKKDITQMVEVLEADYASAEEAAEAVLNAAWKMHEAKAKFTVVGQIRVLQDHTHVGNEDPRAEKYALGWYSTEGQARAAGESLAFATGSNEASRFWVVPVHAVTPAAFYQGRKKEADTSPSTSRAVERIRQVEDERLARLSA